MSRKREITILKDGGGSFTIKALDTGVLVSHETLDEEQIKNHPRLQKMLVEAMLKEAMIAG